MLDNLKILCPALPFSLSLFCDRKNKFVSIVRCAPNTLFALLPTTAIPLVLFVLLFRVLGGGEDRLWLVRAPS